MATNQQRRDKTRTKLIETARRFFSEHGYQATHTGDILDHIKMSRGALYHHFESKRDLFEAVYISTSNDAIDRALTLATRGSSPTDELISGCLAWLQVVRESRYARILLDQGPQVLGWKQARNLEAKSGLGMMIGSLKRAVDAGEINVPSVALTARILNAILAEAALANLHNDPPLGVGKQEETVRQFIEGLRR